MKSHDTKRFAILVSTLFLLFLTACSGGGDRSRGGESSLAAKPCPEDAPAISAGSGDGTYLFYTGCGLWAVDPANPSQPGQIVPPKPLDPDQISPHLVSTSLQRIVSGTWNAAEKKVTGKALHALIYAKAEPDASKPDRLAGHFYRLSAKLTNPLEPVQISSEENADEICGVIALLEDYANINNSLYVYTMPGPDQKCGFSDDNIEKYIQLGMDASTPPVTVPPGREIFSLSDLVKKETGEILGWLAIKPRRKERVLPAYQATADRDKNVLVFPYHKSEVKNGVLKEKPKPPGFLRGTAVMVSPDPISGTGNMGGLNSDTIYIVDSSPTPNIPFECPPPKSVLEGTSPTDGGPDNTKPGEIQLKKFVKKLCLEDDQVVTIDFDASDAELESLKERLRGHRVVKADVVKETVVLTSDDAVVINRVSTYNDLYRCDLKLIDCTLIKETTFKTFCTLEGRDLMGNKGVTLSEAFAIKAYDHHGAPVSGETVRWRRGDQGVGDADLGTTTSGSDGRSTFTGTLGIGPEGGWSIFSARIDGAGSPLGFQVDTEVPLNMTAPSCRRREEYFMLGVFPQVTRGSRAIFSGKIVLRIDLLFKRDPSNIKSEKANKTSSGGILYVYDIDSGELSVDPVFETNRPPLISLPSGFTSGALRYLSADLGSDGSTSSFPDHLPFVYDASHFFFADRGALYSLPLLNSEKASLMVSEGREWQFSEMKLTQNRVVYSLIDLSGQQPITTLKSIARGGGGTASLLGQTSRFLLPIITDETWDRVYFQTMGPNPNPNSDPRLAGVLSKSFSAKEDGSAINEEDYSQLAGRTLSRVIGIENCDKTTFSCAGGNIVSVNATNPADQIVLGTVPSNMESLYFDGLGESVLGEGFADSETDNVEIFFIRGNQAGSLTKTTETPLVPEAIL